MSKYERYLMHKASTRGLDYAIIVSTERNYEEIN